MVPMIAATLAWAIGGVTNDAELRPPIPLRAEGKVIDVDVGHAAPFVCDIGGKKYLLVGQFGSGKLRMYSLSESDAGYQVEKFRWFQAGGQDGKVPTG
ncbi:MAG: hypothetical protein ACFCD0_13285 [Gemmataceae bacterium]